jgi:opacity protein-like surface antigen
MSSAQAGKLPIWVADIAMGAVWENGGATQTLLLAPDVEKTYVANKSTNALFNGEIFLGLQSALPYNVALQYGVTALATTNAPLSGTIYDMGDPEFNNYDYSYNLQHTAVALKGKLLADLHYWVNPWLSASVGIGFNNSNAFQNTPLIFEADTTPNFASKTATAFTYTVGAGLQKTLTTHWQVGAGYEFSDWGHSQLGAAAGQTINRGVGLNHLYTNGILFNFTYLG